MSRRFTDDAKWDKLWFRKLHPNHKLIFLYLCDKCDRAGFWPIDIEQLEFDLGLSGIQLEAIESLKGLSVADGYIDIEDFLSFQYPTGLNANNRAHKGVFEALNRRGELGASKLQASTQLGSHDKDKDMDKERRRLLAEFFMREISRGYGRKLTTSISSTANAFKKLLSMGISDVQIKAAITWLATDNQHNGKYAFQVLSGASLVEKWDKVQAAMSQAARGDRPKSGSSKLPSAREIMAADDARRAARR